LAIISIAKSFLGRGAEGGRAEEGAIGREGDEETGGGGAEEGGREAGGGEGARKEWWEGREERAWSTWAMPARTSWRKTENSFGESKSPGDNSY
jgi:hypothetical protein